MFSTNFNFAAIVIAATMMVISNCAPWNDDDNEGVDANLFMPTASSDVPLNSRQVLQQFKRDKRKTIHLYSVEKWSHFV